MRTQTLAREIALRALYQCDLLGGRSPEELRAFCRHETATMLAEPLPDDAEDAHRPGPHLVSKAAIGFVEGCLEHQSGLDALIQKTAQNWRIGRMPTSDRNILRLGVFELKFRPDTPPKVAINEAIELAKKYSTENSPTFVNGVLDKIYGDLTAAAGSHAAPARFCASDVAIEPDPTARVDMHVHSTASDGRHAPGELPALAAQAGMAAIVLLDHDTLAGIPDAMAAADEAGIMVLPGVEFTCYMPGPADSASVELHMGGVFVDPTNGPLREALQRLQVSRSERVDVIAAKLAQMGLSVEPERIRRRAGGGSIGRTHVAEELVARGLCRDVREAFSRYIGDDCPAYAPKADVSPAEAMRLIREAGGCTFLCHPGLLKDAEFVVEKLAAEGMDGLEVHYPWHTAQQEKLFMELAERLDLAVTGGSDFHGASKPDIQIGREAVSYVELCELKRRAGDSGRGP